MELKAKRRKVKGFFNFSPFYFYNSHRIDPKSLPFIFRLSPSTAFYYIYSFQYN